MMIRSLSVRLSALRRVLLLVSLAFIALSSPLSAENFLHHTLNATILVADPEATAERVASWAEKAGGYYLLKSTDTVVIRFPYQEMGNLRAYLEEIADEVIEISPSAVDLRESILGLRSGIKSREEILQRNLSYVDDADVDGTLAIEQEVVQILAEIEGLKGRLRKLDVDRVFSRAEVYLSFMEETIPEEIPSSFSWINTVDFYRFMGRGMYR
jgi:hypothetical protein